jgi:hypothetical protein
VKKLIQALFVALLLSPVAAYGITTSQIGTNACNATKDASGSYGAVGCDKDLLNGGIFTNAIYVIITIIGAISVLMIVIGGLRYVLSGGDSAGTKSAKETITYALVGLILAMLAGAIVRFVIGAIK